MADNDKSDPEVPSFDDPALLHWIEQRSDPALDELPFGVIAMDRSGTVVAYNQHESDHAHLRPDQVLGRDFFRDVGPCMNNVLVAQRYAAGTELDEQIDFVLTFAMRPTPVRLRLLARAGSPRQYLLVNRR